MSKLSTVPRKSAFRTTKRLKREPLRRPRTGEDRARQPGKTAGWKRRILEKLGDPCAAPAKASDYLLHYPAIARAGQHVVVYLRVSALTQYRKRKMRSQRRWVLQALRDAGAVVLKIFREVGSGWSDCLERRSAAAEYAARHGAVLVFESADRALRSVRFEHNSENPVQPSAEEWEKFCAEIGNVTAATLHHPDMPCGKVRGYQIKRGKNGVCCAPGQKKQRRAEVLPRVLDLRRRWDCSYREIQGETGVPWRTVRDWIKKCA